ncbi:hypothetical protein C2G38_2153244 [Gigaspora rosea]|uniref:Protein kinase domain-containing protein n=1 Tax=Gigaspora rosea TaxID=44941 RepID=A0A397W7Y6_9GLOM|nr:hypothetical protein C2G38_2153244 [Gigaspora rosea]
MDRYCSSIRIDDFGISKTANETTDAKEMYSVIPYMASKIFEGKTYKSFRYIQLWDDYVGKILADILNGLRPKIIDNLPQIYIDLMKSKVSEKEIHFLETRSLPTKN